MATRRTTTRATAHALIEGKTYNTAIPRTTMRFGRNVKLASAQFEQQFTVTNGVPVPSASPTRAAKQKLVVGSMVELSCSRASYVMGTDIDPCLVPPNGIEYHQSNRFRINRVDPGKIYVVVAIDAVHKFMRVMPLFTSRSYSVQMFRESDGNWKINDQHVRRLNPETRQVQYITVPSNTLEALNDVANDTIVKRWHGENNVGQLARCRHVHNVVDLSQLPVMFTEHLKVQARGQVRDQLMERLAHQEALSRKGKDLHITHYMPRERSQRRTNARRIRQWLQGARQLWNIDLPAAQSSLKEAFKAVKTRMSQANTDGDVAVARAATMINSWARKAGVGTLHYAPGCGHFHTEEPLSLVIDRFGSTDMFCKACAADSQIVTTDAGLVLVSPDATTYAWSDGTRRFSREPGIIGGRHSGKGIVGFVEPLVKRQRGSYLTLGLELEMQAYNGNDREIMARHMKTKMVESNLLDSQALRKYLHFEEDGSTGPGGFEMVTGYTDLATHGKLLKTLLCTPEGRPAWGKKLRSHDASGESCGIHVHISKPKTLVHATKMQYFIHASFNAKLVTDIARRYNGSYARINNSVTATAPEKTAVKLIKEQKQWTNRATAAQQQMALNRVNGSDRYQALNFLNANTVEFRIFRGSMLYETVMACMEFTQAVWEFTRYTAANLLTTAKFLEFVSMDENHRSTKNLRNYLKRKGHDVFVAKEKKGPTTTVEHSAPLIIPAEEVY